MEIVIDDPRLRPILEKVEVGQRLSYDDGVTLYQTSDILSVGYMANLVRERLHGSTTYFNVNRHINPTDVCVASCRLCAFGKHAKDPKAYTMSLEEVWHRAGEGWSEAVTEFHIVGGLDMHAGIAYYTEIFQALKARYPHVHIKALTAVELDPALAQALADRLAGTNVEVVNADATNMPFAADRFSGAVCLTMLHHVPSAAIQDRLLAEVARVLRAHRNATANILPFAILGLVYVLAGASGPAAEDVAQETFFRLYRALPHFRGGTYNR